MTIFIKDTDFLPNVKDISNDAYKLLYGVVKLRVERKIYDAITLLCRQYPDEPLRKAKIKSWKSAINGVVSRLEQGRDEGKDQVYVPYYEQLYSVSNLIDLYHFAEDVLTEMEKLHTIPPYRKGMSKEQVQLFFPFGDFDKVMREFGLKCDKSGSYEVCVVEAIEKELEKRGLTASSTLTPAKSYEDIFFGSDNMPIITTYPRDDGDDNDNEDDKLVKTGFLFNALEDFYKKVINNRGRYKDSENGAEMKKLVSITTYRILSGLFDPDNPIAGGDKRTSDNVYYQYANRFRNGATISADSRKRIEDRTKAFISQKKG